MQGSSAQAGRLEVRGITVRFGGLTALDDVSFTVEPGRICGLIGPNGASKTTLFNCISRVYPVQEGEVLFEGRDLLTVARHRISAHGIARTFQNIGLFATQTVLENVMVGAHHRTRAGAIACGLRLPWARAEERRIRLECEELLVQFELRDVASVEVANLPFGTLKRIEIARALAARPRVLLMDEPANGLTHTEVGELSDVIRLVRDQTGVSVVLVEHHMGMVMGLSDTVVALNGGRKIAEGTPTQVQQDPAVVESYLGGGVR